MRNVRPNQLFQEPGEAATREPVTERAVTLRAALLHLAGTVPILLPVLGLAAWSKTPFLRHHARQAAVLSGTARARVATAL